DKTYPVMEVRNNELVTAEAPALNALNEKLRDDYIRDTLAGVARWNRIPQKLGIDFQLSVPHKGFHRQIGPLANFRVLPDRRVISQSEGDANIANWLPTAGDRAYVASLMGRVVERGKFANWIAPPPMGINKQPLDFEYVRFN